MSLGGCQAKYFPQPRLTAVQSHWASEVKTAVPLDMHRAWIGLNS